MKKLFRIGILGLSFLLFLAPNVHALRILNELSRFFFYLQRVLRDLYIIYGITFLLMFALQTAIVIAAMRKVDVFKKGKKEVNKQGKIVAVCMALLSNFAIFYWAAKYKSMVMILNQVLTPFGVFGGFMIAAVMFMIIYMGFKDDNKEKAWKAALVAAGLTMMAFAFWFSYPNVMAYGFLIMAVGLVFFLLSMWKSKESGDSYGKDTQFGKINPSSNSGNSSSPSSSNSGNSSSSQQPSSNSSGTQPSSSGDDSSSNSSNSPATPADKEKVRKKIKELLGDVEQNNVKRQEMMNALGSADNRLDPNQSAKWH
ncbi:hypothetical protein HN419_07230 [Candidatus Woesearchaeota archaeon]|jgi:hypothetical protein|nr:hypothetical protein [Candidatus Woesearchaeota archaeon]MBT3538285.1 hypothetical protein [Candidatus Woesearchaeota archaeon]MBT4698180.1 hypothetical protein [Candidatus Woesearchaeota archaeon]MBT4716839.1 hypothetical protein [Candidatus Woesearchaeota archaeon]MBT7105954.1 hypothetical protein [Candidatus Woesearchaeota archaeon]